MTEAQDIVRRARERGEQRHASRPRIDYAESGKLFRKQKAALTRAVNSGDPEKVILACRKAVQEWNADSPFAGAWPDDWSRWQRALDDALPWNEHIELGDLT